MQLSWNAAKYQASKKMFLCLRTLSNHNVEILAFVFRNQFNENRLGNYFTYLFVLDQFYFIWV